LEFVAKHKFDYQLGKVSDVVTLQDACHLAHAQKERVAPRTILSAIPGLELREMSTPDRCCGSAGIYSIVQPDLSTQVLSAKLEDVLSTDAGTVCTANPGCTLQLEPGLRRESSDMDVRHVIELLAKSVQAGRDKTDM
jgi:glycolate oxidase iron-sulfur subunit